ncbi:MAG TPA: pyrimidine-nucleoside phosphorylase, partial [Clostridiales bacterium]|nr:pyrimidine-nucleoside phosphorylase [Clostridiales bacterium]
KESRIDLSAGVVLKKKVGDPVRAQETIAVVHTNQFEKIEQARKIISDAFTIVPFSVKKPKIVHGILSKNEIKIL